LLRRSISTAPTFSAFSSASSFATSRLALRFGTVLQPMSVVRLPGVRFRVTAHAPIVLEKTGDRPADIARGVQAVTTFVEDRVREVPEDWFWVHKRWPDKVYAALSSDA